MMEEEQRLLCQKAKRKALRLLEKSDAEAFGLYAKALREFDRESLSAWIDYLKSMVNTRPDGTLKR